LEGKRKETAIMGMKMQVLDKVIVINLGISLWSGRKKLKPEDLKGVNLPPDKLASLGSKRVYDPEALNVFANLKAKAERACLKVGTRFLSGYAIPEDNVPALLVELAEIGEEYACEKTAFLNKYQSTLNEWIVEAGEWANIIRAAVETEEAVSEKLSFGFTPFRVGPCAIENENEDADTLAQDLLSNQVNGLAGQLLKEIGLAARQAFEASFKGRTEVTRKALRPFVSMRDKLKGLMFVAPQEIVGMLANINAALDAIPKSGPITGAPLMGLIGVLTELGDIDGFVQAKGSIAEADEEQINLFTGDAVVSSKPTPSKKVRTRTKTKSAEPTVTLPANTDQVDAEDWTEQVETPEVVIIPEPAQSGQTASWFY
jgi:hypothetical protein